MKKETLSKLDQLIIKELSKGRKYEEISHFLKLGEIKPSSIRTIENRIKKLREDYGAKTLFHLAVLLKEENII